MGIVLGSAYHKKLYSMRTYYFKPIVDCPYDFDMRRIHPLKQRVVLSMLKELEALPWVTELWIFGSTLTPLCTGQSDTDIAIRYDEKMYTKSNSLRVYGNLMSLDPAGVDMLYLNTLKESEEIYKSIRKGVCYDRSK